MPNSYCQHRSSIGNYNINIKYKKQTTKNNMFQNTFQNMFHRQFNIKIPILFYTMLVIYFSISNINMGQTEGNHVCIGGNICRTNIGNNKSSKSHNMVHDYENRGNGRPVLSCQTYPIQYKYINYFKTNIFSNIVRKQYIFILTYSTFSKYLQINNNKISHLNNGNKTVNNIKLLHTNKGPAFFENKIDDMSFLIDQHKPDIMSISEANINRKNMTFRDQFPDYNFEINKMSEICNFSRNAIMINKSFKYKRRYDLENDRVCIIWIEVKLSKRKSILIMGGYRQWQLLRFYNDGESGSVNSQLNRLKLITESWANAIKEGKSVVVMMDDNL